MNPQNQKLQRKQEPGAPMLQQKTKKGGFGSKSPKSDAIYQVEKSDLKRQIMWASVPLTAAPSPTHKPLAGVGEHRARGAASHGCTDFTLQVWGWGPGCNSGIGQPGLGGFTSSSSVSSPQGRGWWWCISQLGFGEWGRRRRTAEQPIVGRWRAGGRRRCVCFFSINCWVRPCRKGGWASDEKSAEDTDSSFIIVVEKCQK